jgi:hypothetical protein
MIIFQAETLVLIYKLHKVTYCEDLSNILRTVLVFDTFATGSYKSVPIGFAAPKQFIHLTVKSTTNELTETKFDTVDFYAINIC